MIYQFSLSAQKEYYPVHKKRGIQYFLSGNARMIEGIFYLFFFYLMGSQVPMTISCKYPNTV